MKSKPLSTKVRAHRIRRLWLRSQGKRQTVHGGGITKPLPDTWDLLHRRIKRKHNPRTIFNQIRRQLIRERRHYSLDQRARQALRNDRLRQRKTIK